MEQAIVTIDDYIAKYPADIQEIMQKLRATIRAAAPEATEKISWGMATFVLHGNLVHFAGEKKHIGFHPDPSAIEAFAQELSAFKQSKGTVQFPYDKPIPFDIVRRMVEFRVAEQQQRAEQKKTAKKRS